MCAVGRAAGGARPSLKGDGPPEMMTPDVGCLSIVFYGVYAAVTLPALALPAAISRFPMLDHVWAYWVAGLTIGLGTTAVVVVGSLWLAARGEPLLPPGAAPRAGAAFPRGGPRPGEGSNQRPRR